MKAFPMFLRTTGRRIVILGGGEQAAQKARLALKTDAAICLAFPGTPDEELSALIAEGRITRHAGAITPTLFENCALTFVATGCPGLDAALHAIAKDAGATVNVVDQPDLCDALTPSIVDRDPVVVAIGTEGTAPVLARQIKTRVEEMLEPRLGGLAALAGRLRGAAAQRLSPRARRDLWRWVFNDAPRRAYTADSERAAAKMIKQAISAGGAPASDAAPIALVSTGTGGRDMITLRAVQRLQEADAIFCLALPDDAILELARRDAERQMLNPDIAPEPLARLLANPTETGARVVLLTGHDVASSPQIAALTAALAQLGSKAEIIGGHYPQSARSATQAA
ncbi:bifunctional precorrin-2 dehydrogenase/sirohydrochlorin ferrochelatase [Pseudoruegeria sp. SHC-113]|uniref:precorrin-2 dehydrogenase/sirohydrochlorin ferrochelatase family protein n=1 Tax=Pseudoruegeria sp. SHC-113 TaxID=2855439 RepID=UPI0021BBA067|nr:siroheme synthase [Pseudoruegeria sp. SHC-113]MCT8161078.1 siroheme synthase [Pseudoruegeria sp. SHC-113]